MFETKKCQVNVGPKMMLSSKIVWFNKNSGSQEFWDQKILGPKTILVQKNVESKMILSLKNFGSEKDFGTQENFWP